jgi:hypothetical protein
MRDAAAVITAGRARAGGTPRKGIGGYDRQGRGNFGILAYLASAKGALPRRTEAIIAHVCQISPKEFGQIIPKVSPVDDNDYQIPFTFTGKINKITYALDPPKLSPADIKKLEEATNNSEANK